MLWNVSTTIGPNSWEGLTRHRTTDSKTMKTPNHCVVKWRPRGEPVVSGHWQS